MASNSTQRQGQVREERKKKNKKIKKKISNNKYKNHNRMVILNSTYLTMYYSLVIVYFNSEGKRRYQNLLDPKGGEAPLEGRNTAEGYI